MITMPKISIPSRWILSLLAALVLFSWTQAEQSVVIVYDTQAVGEIEPCG